MSAQCDDDAGAPLHATAAKSRMGHSEPAAGAVGLATAAAGLMQRRTSVLPQLRAINPLVAAILAAQQGSGYPSSGAAWAALPRQEAGVPDLDPGCSPACASGVSSFAFQGTNAHAVLGERALLPGPGQADSWGGRQGGGAAWQRLRFWYVGAAHALLAAAAAWAGSAAFQARLGSAALAYLMDHRVSGRALLPGAAMFEAAAAAARTLQVRKGQTSFHCCTACKSSAFCGCRACLS